MIANIKIIIGALFAAPCSFSTTLNCTKLTTSCPTAAQWSERGKVFNCPGNKRYICLMAPGNELREGCIFNSTIEAGKIGCPHTTQCDIGTGQPVLVTHNYYLPCPPESNGCPPRNHSGYFIWEIYKYTRCQGRTTSDESSVSSDNVTGIPTTIVPDNILQYKNWTLNTLCITLGLLFIFIVCFLVFREKHQGRTEYQNLDFCRKNKGTINLEQLAEMCEIAHEQQYLLQIQDSSSLVTTIETEPQYSTQSIKKTVLMKKDVQRYTLSFISDDSDSSQTPFPLELWSNIFVQDTQLRKAASNGDIKIVNELIYAKADVNAKGFFLDTPLHKAVSNGHRDIVKILVDAKADVNAKDSSQDTPLHIATSNGHIDIVKILIDAKADVNAKNSRKKTPLYIAVYKGHSDIVKILIDAKADINARGSYQDTPLHQAASNGHIDIVKTLIDAKADVNAMAKYQDTPLRKAVSNGHIDIVKILIDAKADVNAKDSDGSTPLHYAVYISHRNIVKILIDAKADVNVKRSGEDTPLHYAVIRSHSDIVKILIDANADVNVKGSYQHTPLHKAVSNGHIDIVKILIDAKADVNAKDSNQKAPLHKAAFNGHIDIVRMLIDAKADVNAKDVDKNTPLHEAAIRGYDEIIRILLSSAADFSITNNNGKTAEELGNPKSKQIFRALSLDSAHSEFLDAVADRVTNENIHVEVKLRLMAEEF